MSFLGRVPTVTTTTFEGGGQGKEEKKKEVREWAEAQALVQGRRNAKQMPEEALADLELVSRPLAMLFLLFTPLLQPQRRMNTTLTGPSGRAN